MLQKFPKFSRKEGKPPQIHLRILLVGMVPWALTFTISRFLGIAFLVIPLVMLAAVFVAGGIHRLRESSWGNP